MNASSIILTLQVLFSFFPSIININRYCFHEVPYWGRSRILKEAHRLLEPGATLAILDISPSYEPSFSMLAGEPYVLEYKENIQLQLRQAKGFQNCRYREVVDGHVGLWLLDRE
mmetsp:Transcript_37885/g.91871  ORF Transcript_37885/g.91871 Transcript_37885/m.91871 type:complete len:114 (+) Transcript_37885:456-797(+)